MKRKHRYKPVFQCDLVVKSTTLKNLQLWINVLPFNNFLSLGLLPSIKRFTLVKSPLGNKRAKDQYQIFEYKYYIRLKHQNPIILLSFLEIIQYPVGVGIKANFSKRYC